MVSAVLLAVHIGAGTLALLCAVVALVTAKGGRYHILAGRTYAIGMTVIFLTALPLAVLGSSIFLLLIAVFSFYLVFAGWRFARNRRGRPHFVDWVAAGVMGVTGVGMLGVWSDRLEYGERIVGNHAGVRGHRGGVELG